jgi:hypothetical protein
LQKPEKTGSPMNDQGTKAQSRTEPTEVDGEGKDLCSLWFLLFIAFPGVLVSWLFIRGNFFYPELSRIKADYPGLSRIIPDARREALENKPDKGGLRRIIPDDPGRPGSST